MCHHPRVSLQHNILVRYKIGLTYSGNQMISARKIRVIGLAVFFLLLLSWLFHAHLVDAESSNDTKIKTLVTSNNLVESTNDEKLDAAINNEISKLSDDDSEGAVDGKQKTAVEDNTGALKDVGDKGKNQEAITADGQMFDPTQELLSIRALSPIVIFSKTYCPYSKKLKHLLQENYQITPAPSIVELDKHKHGAELQAHLGEVTDRKTVPNVLIGPTPKSRGGCDDFIQMHEDGTLLERLKQWGGKGLDVKKVEAPSNL